MGKLAPLPWRAVAALVLLTLARQSAASFFESHAQCGFNSQGFVAFESSPELRSREGATLGVCSYGLPGVRTRLDECVGCTFTPEDAPECPVSTTLVNSTWLLASEDDCQWQSTCQAESTCVGGAVSDTAICAQGGVRTLCCPYKRYLRCCQRHQCVANDQPAGGCVMRSNDLLPGQQDQARVYAASTVSSLDCFSLAFDLTRTCPQNRTFPAAKYYTACQATPLSYDTNGCGVLPGYTFFPGSVLSNAGEALLDDGTMWHMLPGGAAAARAAVAGDLLMQATRCSQDDRCTAFDTLTSPALRFYTPTLERWSVAEAGAGAAIGIPDACQGVYIKSQPEPRCSRVEGYLFTPMHTASLPGDFNAPPASCPDCHDTSALWLRCEMDASCTGFSSIQGTLRSSQYKPTSSLDRNATRPTLWQFTSTPCAGLHTRIAGLHPQDVVDLDKMICGESVYCPSRIEYTSQRVSLSRLVAMTDVRLTVRSNLMLPQRLAGDDPRRPRLKELPNVRSLQIECVGGATLGGSLPGALSYITPFLQELSITNCSASGPLPSEWSALKYLRVLDLSDNLLTGPLPASWGGLRLGFMNLSSNMLTGSVPPSWHRIIAPSTMSPPPPPPHTVMQTSPPPVFPPPDAGSAGSAFGGMSPASLSHPMGRVDLLLLDASYNMLSGELARPFVEAACLDKDLRLVLQSEAHTLQSALRSVRGRGANTDSPLMLLHGNLGLGEWAGSYRYAAAKRSYSLDDNEHNLCGAFRYLIAIGVVWGIAGLALVALTAYNMRRWWQMRRARHAQIEKDEDEVDTASGDSAGWWRRAVRSLWINEDVRRLVLLARLCYLAADVALDIRVTMWLFDDGARSAGIVCAAFLGIAQLVIGLGVYGSLAPRLFGSFVAIFGFAPIMLALMPVLGPLLAVANIRNPDVPLVFWRYLELVEFCVALIQAPAQAVTQTIIYAQQNKLAAGMYLDHALFLASILLSLGDILIALYKLSRYKRGPWQRLVIAFTHLDKARDITAYRTARSFTYEGSPGGSFLEQPLNAPMHTNPLSRMHPSDGPDSPGDDSHGAPPGPRSGLHHRSDGGSGAAGAGPSGSGGSGSRSRSAGGGHTYTHLTAPRYTSMLATSAVRLGGPAALGYQVPPPPVPAFHSAAAAAAAAAAAEDELQQGRGARSAGGSLARMSASVPEPLPSSGAGTSSSHPYDGLAGALSSEVATSGASSSGLGGLAVATSTRRPLAASGASNASSSDEASPSAALAAAAAAAGRGSMSVGGSGAGAGGSTGGGTAPSSPRWRRGTAGGLGMQLSIDVPTTAPAGVEAGGITFIGTTVPSAMQAPQQQGFPPLAQTASVPSTTASVRGQQQGAGASSRSSSDASSTSNSHGGASAGHEASTSAPASTSTGGAGPISHLPAGRLLLPASPLHPGSHSQALRASRLRRVSHAAVDEDIEAHQNASASHSHSDSQTLPPIASTSAHHPTALSNLHHHSHPPHHEQHQHQHAREGGDGAPGWGQQAAGQHDGHEGSSGGASSSARVPATLQGSAPTTPRDHDDDEDVTGAFNGEGSHSPTRHRSSGGQQQQQQHDASSSPSSGGLSHRRQQQQPNG